MPFRALIALLFCFALLVLPVAGQAQGPPGAVDDPDSELVAPGEEDEDADADPLADEEDQARGDEEGEESGDDPFDLGLPPLVFTKTVKGKEAMLRVDGRAAIPLGAPRRVRDLIRAANQIIGKPYVWGGGHRSLKARGYDCSGAVSYALIRSGHRVLSRTLTSGGFIRWAAPGHGRWVTVHTNPTHMYMEVAGLRLDTNDFGDPTRAQGVRWRPVTGARYGFVARHPRGW